jgi:hypothetical protein
MLYPRIKGGQLRRPDLAARGGFVIAKFSRQQLEIIIHIDQRGAKQQQIIVITADTFGQPQFACVNLAVIIVFGQCFGPHPPDIP